MFNKIFVLYHMYAKYFQSSSSSKLIDGENKILENFHSFTKEIK